jgi:hypothetical protein
MDRFQPESWTPIRRNRGPACAGIRSGALGHTDAGIFQGNHGIRIIAHAAVGCATSGVQGGSCGQGAASAGFAAFAGPIIDAVPTYGGQVAAHAVAGGLGSLAAGGKFANGAITGAFGYVYNQAAGGWGEQLSVSTGSSCNLCHVREDSGFPGLLGDPLEARLTNEQKFVSNVRKLASRAEDLLGPGYVYSLRTTQDGNYLNMKYGKADVLVPMKAGDVWKYGESYSPDSRYPASFLRDNRLVMKIEAAPLNLFQAKIMEQTLLFGYTLTHGGDLPPGNKIMR